VENIFGYIPKILGQLEDNEEAREAFAFAAWRKSVGASLNEQTAPIALTDARLRIAVSNETLRRHLVDMAGEILFKLNSNLARSSVRFLEFLVDQKAIAENRLAHPRTMKEIAKEGSADDEITNDLRDSAAAIEDADLRRTFLLAAGSCLARTKRNTKDK